MWRPSLTTRFFLALAALAMALVILPGVAIRWSVRHDIVEYVHKREFARLQPLQEALIEAYQTHGNWQFLQGQSQRFDELIQASGVIERRRPRRPRGAELLDPRVQGHEPRERDLQAHERREHEPHERRQRERELLEPDLRDPSLREHGPGENRGPLMAEPFPPEPLPLNHRLQVLDVNYQLIVGRLPPPEFDIMQRPLLVDGKPIGHLQLQIPPFVRDGLEQRLLSGQLNTLLMISGGALLLALTVAWWLGRGLVKPILSVASTVRQLAGGQLAARTIVSRGDELGQLARDVDRLAETLTANERLRRELMADVSHEFRTPLALLQAKIEAMQDGVLPSDQKTFVSLHDATMRLSRMVDDLYQVALADTGALRLHYQAFSLRELIDQSVADAHAKIAAAGLRIHVEGMTTTECLADRQRLRQVLDNLLHNAVRYTDAGGEIRVQLQQDGAFAQLLIEDSAPGVPDAFLDKLFDRFFRVESSRSRDAGGSGLGLSVVKAIVQAHDGTVSASHSSLGGLAIMIRLPLQRAERTTS